MSCLIIRFTPQRRDMGTDARTVIIPWKIKGKGRSLAVSVMKLIAKNPQKDPMRFTSSARVATKILARGP
jgi:hypothetical protein